MENFQKFISRLAETGSNNPLNASTKTLLQCRLNQFVSQYKTPDHPPYSAMILRALEELNEKRGSSEESISQYIEKTYENLPWAHSELLKHHLKKLCETDEIVVTRDKRYGLPGCLNLSTEVKKRAPRRKRRWRHDWERERHHRLKKKLSKKRNKKDHEKDEKDQRLTENGACSEDKSNQTNNSLSCVGEKEHSEEIVPSGTVQADIQAAQKQVREQSSQPGFENEHPLEPYTKTISPKQEDTFEGKHLGMRLRPRRAKTEVSKDEDFVASTNELLRSTPKCLRLKVIHRPKPDAADVEDLGPLDLDLDGQRRQGDCASSAFEKTEPPQRRVRFRLSNAKQKVQIRRGRGRPPKRRAT